ncbi:MAG TPA: YcnI family protein [Acidimicrobiales bacterium]|nr:YcnI family protein [Acidimicrobiales bacterium]
MSIRSTLTVAGLSAAGLLALAAPAAAHVGPSETSAPAGSYLKFELRVPHGCGETGNTTRVEVQVPDGITSVTPQVVPGWTIERTTEQLDPPLDDGHGGQIAERTSVVTWTGGPLAHDQLEEFGLSVKLPEEPGTILFPTIQTCDDGTTAEWIEVPPPGGEEPEKPAPAIEVTVAAEDLDEAEPASATDDDDDDDGSSRGLAIAGIALGAAGLATGGAALRRARTGG